MTLKRLIISILSGSFILLAVAPALAQNSATQNMRYPVNTAAGSDSAGLKTGALENLRARATAEIDRRVMALNKALDRLKNMKKISDADKSSLSSQIQTEITNLTTLKSKIQADSDLATLRADTQSIITSYRVFLLFLPQMRLLAGADSINQVADNLSTLKDKLKTRITAAQTAGKDVTALLTLLSDMDAKITDSKALSTAISTEIVPLTPAGYPGNSSVLQDAKTKLMAGITDLKTAGQDAKQIIQGLKAIGKTGDSMSTPSAKPL